MKISSSHNLRCAKREFFTFVKLESPTNNLQNLLVTLNKNLIYDEVVYREYIGNHFTRAY